MFGGSLMELKKHEVSLKSFPASFYNEEAYAVCCALAWVRTGNAVTFIGGGNAADRLALKKALLQELENTNTAYCAINCGEFTDQLVEAIREDKINACVARYQEAELLVLDDAQYLGGKDATQEFAYDILKKRAECGRLTLFFASRPYAALAKDFRTDLYALMGSGEVAAMSEHDSWEEFFFRSNYDEMLRFTFLNADGKADCSEEDAQILADFLERMSDAHVHAAAWAVLIAAYGSSEFFSKERAMRILSKRKGVMEAYRELLLKELGSDALDDEQVDEYYRKPFVWAAQGVLEKVED